MRLVQHCRKLLSALKKQRELEPLLCDLTLRSLDDRLLRCHKAVLSANSEYFNAMLTSSFVEACQSVVRVPFTGDILENVIDFFYDGYIHLSVENCLEYLEAADMLLAQDLIAECQEFVGQNLSQVLNCEETLVRDSTSLAHLLPVLQHQSKLNLKQTFSSLHRWVSEDRANRVRCFMELEMAVVERLQSDLEVKLVVAQESLSNNEVFVNFQNAEQVFPHLLKFDGERWSKCLWPRDEDLPYNCEHFCIVKYGTSLLYCKTQGDPVVFRELGKPDRPVEETAAALIAFLKSERHIFLHKVTLAGERLKVFDRHSKMFRSLELPACYKLIKVNDKRIAEDVANNEIFLSATMRFQDSMLQEGVFCFKLNAQQAWIAEHVSLLPYKSCERDIPTVFCGHPVILSPEDRRAFVHERGVNGQWREKLCFPMLELDSANFKIIYVCSSKRKLYLVVDRDQDVRIVCYDELWASGHDVTEKTEFPSARVDYERGVVFCPREG
ncbi:uncharacterized protein LOC114828346 [Galendromus occidentalis]|uniref:Uncharacterized protein LOC114828346 n=1 Tax=Galendromus occidentalis TaxID=34638 RepID=A0AAJ7WID5_9ACAR|nr:uncharacterized protein LOC114828346 [Galendromus occidentalis]